MKIDLSIFPFIPNTSEKFKKIQINSLISRQSLLVVLNTRVSQIISIENFNQVTQFSFLFLNFHAKYNFLCTKTNNCEILGGARYAESLLRTQTTIQFFSSQ